MIWRNARSILEPSMSAREFYIRSFDPSFPVPEGRSLNANSEHPGLLPTKTGEPIQ